MKTKKHFISVDFISGYMTKLGKSKETHCILVYYAHEILSELEAEQEREDEEEKK